MPAADRTQMVARFVARNKRKPSDRSFYASPGQRKTGKAPPVRLPGPNAPDPKADSGVLGIRALKGSGAYLIPGIGEVSRTKNRRRYRESHAFNPDPTTRGRSWS